MNGFGLRRKPRCDSAHGTEKGPRANSGVPMVVCYKCGFESRAGVKSGNVKFPGVGQCKVIYLMCSNCGKLGVISISDKKLQKMDKEVVKARDKLAELKSNSAQDPKEIEGAQARLKRISAEAEERSKRLARNFELKLRLRKVGDRFKLQFVPELGLE